MDLLLTYLESNPSAIIVALLELSMCLVLELPLYVHCYDRQNPAQLDLLPLVLLLGTALASSVTKAVIKQYVEAQDISAIPPYEMEFQCLLYNISRCR